MNHNKSYRKLGRRSAHRKAMMMNLTNALLISERIETTLTRAKELRKFVERMITLGKKYNKKAEELGMPKFSVDMDKEAKKAYGEKAGKIVYIRREALSFLRSNEVVKKLFDEIAPKYMDRNGGYTRITKTNFRKGDSAEMAIIELL